jgi:hypothetical protein
MEQETGESNEVPTCQHGRQSLVVAGQPTAAGLPGEAALGHRAARQQHKARLASGSRTTFNWMPSSRAIQVCGFPFVCASRIVSAQNSGGRGRICSDMDIPPWGVHPKRTVQVSTNNSRHEAFWPRFCKTWKDSRKTAALDL